MRVLPPVWVGRGGPDEIESARGAVQRGLKALALSGTMAHPRHFVPQRDGYWDGYDYRIDPVFAQLAAEIERHRAEVGTVSENQAATSSVLGTTTSSTKSCP